MINSNTDTLESSTRCASFGRPAEDEFLCSCDFMFVEYQQNPCEALRFLEQQPNRLIAGSRRAPAALFARYDRTLDGMRLRSVGSASFWIGRRSAPCTPAGNRCGPLPPQLVCQST